MKSKTIICLPLPVRRSLQKLGADMADARKRRRISTAMMAERAMVSRPTLVRLEKGDPTVSAGILATVLFVLGLEQRLADLADATHDRLGLDLEAESLPMRIRGPGKKRFPAGGQA
jgi:transcriptional regulator with XRE-family HTH domain